MNKYVMELYPNCKVVQQICESDGQLSIHSKWVDYLEELNSDYINKNFGDLQDAAYQKGLEEGKAQFECGCEGCEYEGKIGEHLPCDYCMNNFTNQWKSKSVQFEFGDEIIDVDGIKGCVISKNNEEYDTIYALFDGCRVPQYVTKKYYRKTGRHFDIDKILEEMKE